jgi:hypothetical protein
MMEEHVDYLASNIREAIDVVFYFLSPALPFQGGKPICK